MQVHIFESRELVVEAGVLEDDTKRAPHLLALAHRIVAVDANGAARRIEHGGQHLYGSSFFGAVRSEETENLSFRHRKRDVVDRAEIPIVLDEIPHYDYVAHRGVWPWRNTSTPSLPGDGGTAYDAGESSGNWL